MKKKQTNRINQTSLFKHSKRWYYHLFIDQINEWMNEWMKNLHARITSKYLDRISMNFSFYFFWWFKKPKPVKKLQTHTYVEYLQFFFYPICSPINDVMKWRQQQQKKYLFFSKKFSFLIFFVRKGKSNLTHTHKKRKIN